MPTLGHGKICHIALPVSDIERSANFYHEVFGWQIHRHGGPVTFDDAVGEVSGHFVDREPATGQDVRIYIMVDNLQAALSTLTAHGAEIVAEPGVDLGELTALFRDPGGNILGVYEEPRA